jgi:hypothetical protein
MVPLERAVTCRRGFLSLFAAGLAAVLVASPAAAQDTSLGLAVKATYLYKFAPFVEWPKAAFASPESPLVLCVAGDDPFGQMLDEAVSGRRVSGRAIDLRRMERVGRDSGCDILFAAGSPAQSVAAALAAVRGTPVLTVTDSERTGAAKGIINFVIRSGHVRFEIDNTAALENGLVISSKLLSLAVT